MESKKEVSMEHIFLTEIDILLVRHLKNIKIKLSRDEMKHLILTELMDVEKQHCLMQLAVK